MNLGDRLKVMSLPQAFVFSIILAGVYYMVLYDDGTALEAQMVTLRQQINTHQAEISKINRKIEEARKYTQVKAEMGGELERVLKYIPEDLGTPDLMKLLSTEAKAAGANIIKISDQQTPDDPKSMIQKIGVDVELQGSYSQLLLFLSYLTRVEKIINMGKLHIEKSSTNVGRENLLNFSASFVGYRFTSKEGAK